MISRESLEVSDVTATRTLSRARGPGGGDAYGDGPPTPRAHAGAAPLGGERGNIFDPRPNWARCRMLPDATAFAYGSAAPRGAVRCTRAESWRREELFTRVRPVRLRRRMERTRRCGG